MDLSDHLLLVGVTGPMPIRPGHSQADMGDQVDLGGQTSEAEDVPMQTRGVTTSATTVVRKGTTIGNAQTKSNFNNFLNARAFVFWDAKLFNNVNLIFKCQLKNKTFESSEGLCQILSKYQKYDFVVQLPYSHQLNLHKNNTQILSIL